jgi:prepilin-type N-terminal cleavage/methylation domain-containing protein
MQRHSARHIARAFTLIELLTVIAIIAILAAILFPIFATVREQTRQSSTLSKMHSIYVGARLFYEDEGRFPPSLFGYAEVPLTNPSAAGPFARPATPMDTNITSMDKATGSYNTGNGLIRGYLFGEQVKDYVTFLNDDNIGHTKFQTTQVYYPTTSPYKPGQLVTWINPANSGMAGNGCPYTADIDFPCGDGEMTPCSQYDGVPKLFYIQDSMDIGPALDNQGHQLIDPMTNGPKYELHYSPDWTHELYNVSDPNPNNHCDVYGQDKPYLTQLKYKNPPSESTIICWSTQHVATAGSPSTLILLASGTARKINYLDGEKQLPLNYNH